MIQTLFVYSLLTFSLFIISTVYVYRKHLSPNNIIKASSFFTIEIFLIIILFAIIFGIRYDVGTDHLSYLYSLETGYGIERFEYAFYYITVFFREFKIPYPFYFGFIALIQIFFFILALKDERYIYPFLFLTLFMGQFFWQWMNIMRQETAGCIFLFSTQYIIKKKPIKFLFWIIIASCFHKSAIILILTYPLACGKDITLNKYVQLILLLTTGYFSLIKYNVTNLIGSSIAGITLLTDFNNYDLNSINYLGEITNVSSSYIIIFIIINSIIIINSEKLKLYFKNARFIIIYYNLYFWGYIFQLALINNLILERPFRYFRYFQIIILSFFLYYLNKNGKSNLNKFYFMLIIVLLCLSFILLIKNYPYHFIGD